MSYNPNDYFVDFNKNKSLSKAEKKSLMEIQKIFKPAERTSYMLEYVHDGKISEDDFTKSTGVPLY